VYREQHVVEVLWKQGERLRSLVNRSIAEHKLESFFQLVGRPCNLIFQTRDRDQKPSQAFRTLFMQELIARGIIGPSFVVSFSHTDADIDRTGEVVSEALYIYRKALDEGIEKYLHGRPVKPVNRAFA
jgi:glutamate-1-semialdehyde 2,1-aminomutase